MRLLGVDLGEKRIGVAVAELEFQVATARPALRASGRLKADAQNISEFAAKERADRVILGLPIEESGEEGRMARVARQLAEHIRSLGVEVELVDERMTSVESEKTLLEAGLKASVRRRHKDGAAASLILERYMHGQAAS